MATSTNRKPQQLGFLNAAGTAVALPKKPRRRTPNVKLGRRPRPERRGFVAHKAREPHHSRHPVHVSMRREKLAPSLRSERIFNVILRELARAKAPSGRLRTAVRVVHFSVQHDHVHLIVEGQDRHDVSNQMRKLFSRIAMAVNAIAKRRGRLFRDRHHRHELATPTEARNALVYVLFNERKHDFQNGGPICERTLTELDDRSSVAWVHGWSEEARPPPELLGRWRQRILDVLGGDAPICAPTTWLAQAGWREKGGGALRVDEVPRFT